MRSAALLLLLVLAPLPAEASPRMGIQWPEDMRHLIILDGLADSPPFVPEWERMRDTVLMRYTATGFTFTVQRIGPTYCPPFPPEQAGTILLCNGFPRTYYWIDGDHITSVVIPLQHDEGLFCHELGHALGLDHYTRKPKHRSCMWSIEYKKPSPHDIAALLPTHQD